MKGVSLDQILLDLNDEDPEIKRLAATALLAQNDEDLIKEVLAKVDRATQEVLYNALFDAEGDYAKIFRDATADDDPSVRRLAIRYIFRKGRFCLEDGLKWLEDRDPYVRRRVVNYLSWINESRALKPIASLAVNDPDPLVRSDALRLIALWGNKGEAELIIQALDDDDLQVRSQAVYALSRITGEDFGDPISASEDELEWIVAKWQAWWEIVKEGR